MLLQRFFPFFQRVRIKRESDCQNGVIHSRIPPGRRIYAIGDIHGRLDLLEQLLEMLCGDRQDGMQRETCFIFLGDVIDRGPHSAQVVDRLLDFSASASARFVRGNHEDILLSLLADDPAAARQFAHIGGRETAFSYGVTQELYRKCRYEDLGRLMRSHIPERHRNFYLNMEEMIEIGDYLFVHAGIDPAVAISKQDASRTRWIRDSFTGHAGPFEKVIVHGHSMTMKAQILPHRIGVDTGAYRSGMLTAVGLEENRRWLVQARSNVDH